jgi:hypothetical protein
MIDWVLGTNNELLRSIFAFVPGSWLYAGAVSSAWKQAYEQVPQLPLTRASGARPGILCCSRTTYMAAAFASEAALRLAVECGLDLQGHSQLLQRLAGRHADLITLQLAAELGLPWTAAVSRGAASACDLPKLQWLYEQQCPRSSWTVITCAAASGCLDTLLWLQQKHSTCRLSLKYAFIAAARCGHLDVVKHMYDNYRCRLGPELVHAAVKRNQIHMLNWLHEKRCPGMPFTA